jgi:hypothetical protein
MSAGERLVGAGAALMAACCVLLPVLGGALGGGLIAGVGGLGALAGVALLAAVVALVVRFARSRRPR